MRKNMKEVLEAWDNHRAMGGKTCHTDGETVWSYDMPIMQRLPDGRVEVIERESGPTPTTRAQIVACAVFADYAKEVKTLTGRAPHVFRDRAGQSGYLGLSNTPRSRAYARNRG